MIEKRILENDHIALKKCKHGFMLYNINDTYVGKSLDIYGEWCDAELDLLKQIIRPDFTVLDIGANIGTHTVFFAKQLTNGVVYAFEPQRLCFQLLNANIAINALNNVLALQKGVSNLPGKIKLPDILPNIKYNRAELNIENHDTGDEVEIITIDQLDLRNCNIMKIDVEGMESKVLEGSRETISKFKPIIFIENNDTEKSSEVIDKLFGFGYKCWWHISSHYNEHNYFNNPKAEITNNSANMICIHKDINVKNLDLLKVEGVHDDWKAALTRILSKQSS